jgi:dephospho-CoA kinase
MIVGITGGIGSGKSIVSHIFELLGVSVYNSDIRSKELLNKDPELISKLIEQFGEEIYTSSGIDRKHFASLIFNDKKLLEISNNIIHPFVRKDFENWVDAQSSPYVIKESAILFETGIYKQLNKIILVTAPEKIRIKRVQEREQISKDVVLERINNQWEESKKIPLADFVIFNDETQMLLPQILKIHQLLSNSAYMR